MAIFTTTGPVDMTALFPLDLIKNTGDYFDVSNISFSVDSADLFPTHVEVGGIFVPSIALGTVTSIVVDLPDATGYAFQSLATSYSNLIQGLDTSSSQALKVMLAGQDRINGSGWNDVLLGYGGKDELWGGGGKDLLRGGAGDDLLSGGQGLDRLDGGTGFDTATYADATAKVSVVLDGSHYADVTIGGTLADKVKNIEAVLGGKAGDMLVGDGNANKLSGNGGADTIKGKGGADVLDGGTGNDVLVGGGGADIFTFSTALNAKTNVDTIQDFHPGVDKIHIHLAIPIHDDMFAVGAPETALGTFVYKPGSGKLLYDADGTGDGKGIVFAQLDAHLSLSESDFIF
jgi:Ca2+-binding RTX toxin-like protein